MSTLILMFFIRIKPLFLPLVFYWSNSAYKSVLMFQPSLDMILALLKHAGIVYSNDFIVSSLICPPVADFTMKEENVLPKRKGERTGWEDSKKHTDNSMWAPQTFPIFMKDGNYERVLLSIWNVNSFIYVKASYYQIFVCIMVRSWTGGTMATHWPCVLQRTKSWN